MTLSDRNAYELYAELLQRISTLEAAMVDLVVRVVTLEQALEALR